MTFQEMKLKTMRQSAVLEAPGPCQAPKDLVSTVTLGKMQL